MKIAPTSLIAGVAALAFGPLASAQANRISYPSEDDAVLVIEQTGADEVRAGSSYEYSLRVRNVSEQPLHQVRLHQMLPSNFQIESESAPGEDGGASGGGGVHMRQPAQEDPREQQAAAMDGERASLREERRRQDAAPQEERPQLQSQQQPRQQQQQQGQQAQQRQQTGEEPQAGGMNTRVWTIGVLMPGQDREIRVSGVPLSEGPMESCVFASYEKALCTTVRVIKPELRLTRQWVDEDGQLSDRFFVCDPFGIRYTIRNEGTGTTPPATITEELPEGITGPEGLRRVTIDVGELAAGEEESVIVNVQGRDPGQYESRATASAGELEARSNADSVTLYRGEIDVEANGRGQQYIGREVRYDITVSNLSEEAPAENVRVRMPGINERMRFASNDQNVPMDVDVFTLGTLEPGQSRTFGVVFSSDEAGEIATQVEANAYCAESATATLSTTFEGIAALQISAVDQRDPVPVGEETTYEISVWNEGTAEDANISLSGELPENVEFVNATGDSDVNADGSQLEFGSVESLAPGERASWLITVRGAQAGKGELKLELESENSGSAVSGEPTTVY